MEVPEVSILKHESASNLARFLTNPKSSGVRTFLSEALNVAIGAKIIKKAPQAKRVDKFLYDICHLDL